jgi:hypothetical protein
MDAAGAVSSMAPLAMHRRPHWAATDAQAAAKRRTAKGDGRAGRGLDHRGRR